MMNKMKAEAASALGAKTARACDSCMIVRARWYCAADDAFLCHGCDKLVHSANQLASKHERVKLQTASSKVNSQSQTSWHSGFTRKARTPRHNKNMLVQQQQQQHKDEEEKELFFTNNTNNTLPLVPELGSEEPFLDDENEEQLLFRVPVFDPFDEGICSEVKGKGLDTSTTMKNIDVVAGEEAFDLENFCSEFLPSDMNLDVESLLGNRVDEDSSGHVKRSTLLGCKEDEIGACVNGFNGANGAMVKVKGEELDADHTTFHLDSVLDDMNGEEFDWNVEEKVGVPSVERGGVTVSELGTKKENFLRLNYGEVITAWASQAHGSPWTTGSPPKFNFDDCWLDFLDSSGGTDVQCSYEEVRSLMGQQIGGGDVGREARVSRYREKRRTRLFAKKIRYEVRKLNAEKRPRMKGRFVKRTSFVGATALQA